MTTTPIVLIVLTYPNGDYVALDQPSGGYPYATKDIHRAHKWKSIKEMGGYMKMFEREQFVPKAFKLTEQATGIIDVIAMMED